MPSARISNSAPERIQINVNGEQCWTQAPTLEDLLASLDFSKIRVATAVNGDFIPAAARARYKLAAGDRIEIVSARQGG